ncbi:MAG TPA: YdeI/OmpD-associated family protein [Ohtaekwangia sp.]|nr:YdeI/OmpD-associated family protein [Ohtaekwangia sp.]
MIAFSTRVKKFDKKGEKTGWTYIEISKRYADQINPGCKTSFRIKGKLDHHEIGKTALLPMGDGDFILPFNSAIRKGTGKKMGDLIKVEITLDTRELTLSKDFVRCLKDDPIAFGFFKSLPKGHQNYFSKWIDSAKTSATKTKRITMAVIALALKQGYGEMIRASKGK